MPDTCWATKRRPFLAAFAGGVSVEGTKSDPAIVVGGDWVDTSTDNTVSETMAARCRWAIRRIVVATDGINGVNTRIQRQR